MPTYKLLRGSMLRWVEGKGRVRQEPGDLIADLTLNEINTHKERLEYVSAEPFAVTRPLPPLAPAPTPQPEPVSGSPEPEADEDADAAVEYDWTDVLSGNVADIKSYIADLDDADMVQSLADAEKAGQSRKGVLMAVVERLRALGKAHREE